MSNIPSLYEWMGGMPALERLTKVFYERVPADEVLAPVFSRMSPEHPKHVAEFLGELEQSQVTGMHNIEVARYERYSLALGDRSQDIAGLRTNTGILGHHAIEIQGQYSATNPCRMLQEPTQ